MKRLLSILLLTLGVSTMALHSAAAAQPAARPNLLFVIADDWGVHAGAYGTRWVNTPGFDRVAREGLLFNQAYTPNAKCAPARAILLTGRHSWQLEEAANHMAFFPAKFKSYPEALAEHGYTVGMTGKGWGPGIANDAGGKPRQIAGRPFNRRTLTPPARGINTNDYAANFIDFLDSTAPGQPWCFWLGTTEPHRGYEYGVGVAKGGKKLSDIDRVPRYWPDNEIVRNDMLDYGYEVEWVDQHLVRALADLERRGQLDNTVVVVTSDHGMPFPRVKGQAYLDSNRIPLAIRWPGGIRNPGRVIDDFVDFTDVAATFLDLAGLPWAASGMAPITGRSWREIFESTRSGRVVASRDHVLIGKERHDVGRPNDFGYPIRGIVRDGFLYLKNYEPDRWPVGNPETGYLNTDGSPTKTFILDARRKNPADRFWALNFGRRPAEELYDLKRDPDCVDNLANVTAHAKRREALHRQMVAALTAQGDPRMAGRGEIFDRYPVATEPNRNFYERFIRGENPRAGWVNETDFEKTPIK
jgi:N-sulfoglucosamine sulfohydrolase